ncbi:hypothetical protein BDZ89DRAFT_1048024 [Hymenopellis radicata]|nr:hypothetical protein BDZ89DRAFT_1048024 [Hymenopellis radicata]
MIPQLRLSLFGTGLSWDEVYAALDPYGVNVVGSRVPGPGVAGLSLEEGKYRATSGYLMLKCPTGLSWFTNQYGLTLDTIMAMELVQPNSTVSNITQESDPDLRLSDSMNFMNGELNPMAMVFYDAPTAPSGVFDDFLNLQSNAVPFGITAKPLSTETAFWASRFGLARLSSRIIPPDVLVINPDSPTAYPPPRKATIFPLCLFYAWSSSDMDEYFLDNIRASANQSTAVAIEDGQVIQDVALYPNYASFDTPPSRIFGDNMERLEAIKVQVDPQSH